MFNALMVDTVTLRRKSGTATWGETAWADTSVKARVEGKNARVQNQAGEVVIAQVSVLIANTTLTAVDKIVIDGVERSIISIRKLRSFSTVDALEVWLG